MLSRPLLLSMSREHTREDDGIKFIKGILYVSRKKKDNRSPFPENGKYRRFYSDDLHSRIFFDRKKKLSILSALDFYGRNNTINKHYQPIEEHYTQILRCILKREFFHDITQQHFLHLVRFPMILLLYRSVTL